MPGTGTLRDGLAEAVDAIFDAFASGGDDAPAPGLAWGVVRDGALVHAAGRGTLVVGEERAPGSGAVFRIASMTKSLVAALVLLLRDEGALRLDDPVRRHVPAAAALDGATADARPITVLDLLAMRGGLPEDDAWADRLEDLDDGSLVALLDGGTEAEWGPGLAYRYANLGYAILGRVVEAAGGTPLVDAVAERLLEPLGMDATTFDAAAVPEAVRARGYHRTDGRWEEQPSAGPGAFSPIGGLSSSVADVARWVAGLATAWPARSDADDGHPLARATRRELQQVATALPLAHVRAPGGGLAPAAVGYCLGLVSTDTAATGRVVGHSGGYPGFGSHMRWHPASGWGVVALGNARYVPVWEPAADALALLVSRGALPRRPAAAHAGLAEARAAAERLLAGPDAATEERWAAPCLVLDEPLAHRRAAFADAQARLGPLAADDAEPEVPTPRTTAWWLGGARGRLRLELALTPERPARIQRLDLVAVPAPPERLLAAARALARTTAGAGAPPDAEGAQAAAEQARVLLGPCRLGDAVAGDGERSATFRLVGDGAQALLEVDGDGAGGLRLRLRPAEAAPVPD